MFKITKQELILALSFGILGYLASSRNVILYLNELNPLQGLVVYYVILYASLYLLSKAGLIIYKFKITNATQTLGLLMITFAFFIIVGWTSAYIQYVTTGSLTGASVIFYQCEDGASWYFWNTVMNVQDIELARILAFAITPFLLALGGSYLVTKPKILS